MLLKELELPSSVEKALHAGSAAAVLNAELSELQYADADLMLPSELETALLSACAQGSVSAALQLVSLPMKVGIAILFAATTQIDRPVTFVLSLLAILR